MLSRFSILPEKNLNQTSNAFRQFFLLAFTRELIHHAKPGEILELNEILKHVAKENKIVEKGVLPEIIKEQVKQELHPSKEEELIEEDFLPKPRPRPVPLISPRIPQTPHISAKPVKKIPLKKRSLTPWRTAPKLPPRLQYIRPVPRDVEVDLGGLNPLIQDPMVRSIECNGADQPIMVRGNMGSKKTNLAFGEEGIRNIIDRFAVTAQIPVEEGASRIVVGKLVLSAIVSDVVGSKFIIQKMLAPGMRG
ncbi:MAG: hypothetical protein ABIB79_04795 [archaeon]